ncbi:ComEC/Rec2 family competence protein [Pedobacter panaciterrae]|uniref:ComEC/Rec2 family competence protein n=1 Tax=Pedobacter panaciterrae TaxID=363849 RepID=UPI002591C7E2|nr:hypothetical protein [uncultured Pedobacter sp.]
MFKLHVIQAKFGDSLLLEFGNKEPLFILIDGGPANVYNDSLRGELKRIIGDGGELEALIISHVDIDHIQGVVDLLAELQGQKDNGDPLFLKIKQVWLNTFSQMIDSNSELAHRMNQVYTTAGNNGINMAEAGIAVQGIKEGDKITRYCKLLEIPMNQEANQSFFCVDRRQKDIPFSNLIFQITGPTKANLSELKNGWEKWIKEQENAIANGTHNVLAMADKSIPNLSSLAFLVKSEDKTILFTGDGRGDHLIQGLEEKNLLNDRKIHVDILKVAHHGSERNVDLDFFERITADTYVISANGKHDNPDYQTLVWIVEAARTAKRRIRLVITNDTLSTKKLRKNYSPEAWGYAMDFIEDGNFSIEL